MFKISALTSMSQADYNVLKDLMKKYGPDTVVSRVAKVCKAEATETAAATDYKGKLMNSYFTAVANKLEEAFPSEAAAAPAAGTGAARAS